MADIDFTRAPGDSFQITITNNPQTVTGNRALLNRFQTTFLTKKRLFLFDGDREIFDNYGGDAFKFIDKPQIASNTQSLASALTLAINETVESMQGDEPDIIPNTEKIAGAELLDIDIQVDSVVASIQILPVETERFGDLIFNLPLFSANNT